MKSGARPQQVANADILAERSGRWPSHPTRSQRAGSNPAGVHPLAIADVNSPAAREHRCAALAARGDAPLPSEVKSSGVEPNSFLLLSLAFLIIQFESAQSSPAGN